MSDQSTSGDPIAAFGPNEWLVDELYQQFLTDKTSVDKAWWGFFEDYRPGEADTSAAPSRTATATATRPQTTSAGAGAATANGSTNGSPAATRASTTKAPEAKAAPAAKAAEAKAAPAAKPAEAKAEPKAEPKGETPKPRDIPAVKGTGPVSEDIVTPLRGAPSRVVANMEVSLTVPTATSVRAVPAKLLIDNRVVINNHLAARVAARSASRTSSATPWSRPWPSCRR